VNEGRLIVGGWVLVVPTPTPRVLGRTLPDTLITISQCIMEDLPQPEFWDWYQDPAEAERARETSAPQSRVMTVAMHPDDADAFLSAREDVDVPYLEVLRQGQPLPETVRALGYEVVGADLGWFHSWHCHGYADEAATALGIRVNAHGLLPDRDSARTVLEWMLQRPPSEAPGAFDWTAIAVADELDVASHTQVSPSRE
jgi:hypothetical protein